MMCSAYRLRTSPKYGNLNFFLWLVWKRQENVFKNWLLLTLLVPGQFLAFFTFQNWEPVHFYSNLNSGRASFIKVIYFTLQKNAYTESMLTALQTKVLESVLQLKTINTLWWCTTNKN